MRTATVWLLAALAVQAGCSSTGTQAPIRERAPSPRSGKPPTPAPGGKHVVRPGDTLYSIAFQHGLDYRALAVWNDLADPNRLSTGTVLRLTAPPRPVVVARPANLPEPPRPEPLASPAPRWDWPARGRILKGFDSPAGSKGMDIAGARSSPVRAAAAGQVLYAGDGLRGYGKLIIIKHSDTLLSAYAHQEKLLVAEGHQVALGQVVGRMGDSDARRVMLHFEIREQGKPVNPLKYLPN